MARVFSDIVNADVQMLLNKLIEKTTGPYDYASAMYALGKEFGHQILEKIKDNYDSVSLVSTVEDTDSLAKGILDVLEAEDISVKLTVFWNKRFIPSNENNIAIAPILKEFHEATSVNPKCLVIIKSIISSSCVIRTNLTRFIETNVPEQIFVVAPVLLEGAIPILESEFEKEISSRFQYLYFAQDNEQNQDGIVLPGIGGDVYQRLGFLGQTHKNRHIPEMVKQRRYTHT